MLETLVLKMKNVSILNLKRQENERYHLGVITQVHGTCTGVNTSPLHVGEAAGLCINNN